MVVTQVEAPIDKRLRRKTVSARAMRPGLAFSGRALRAAGQQLGDLLPLVAERLDEAVQEGVLLGAPRLVYAGASIERASMIERRETGNLLRQGLAEGWSLF